MERSEVPEVQKREGLHCVGQARDNNQQVCSVRGEATTRQSSREGDPALEVLICTRLALAGAAHHVSETLLASGFPGTAHPIVGEYAVGQSTSRILPWMYRDARQLCMQAENVC